MAVTLANRIHTSPGALIIGFLEEAALYEKLPIVC
jgi:hypothetical protein